MPEPSILDARLAEIDRRLRMIQSGLEPVRDIPEDLAAPHDPSAAPPPPPPPIPDSLSPPSLAPMSLIARRLAPPPAPVPPDGRDEEIAVLTARLSELTATHERLLATTQDLLVEQAGILARAAPSVSVMAGPFADTRALQEFQHAVNGLPQVREVAVREYVGAERVVLDVHLDLPIS